MRQLPLLCLLFLAGCGGRTGLLEGDGPQQFPQESPGAGGSSGAGGASGASGSAGSAGAAASVVRLGARGAQSCALRSDGRVSCWGSFAGAATPSPQSTWLSATEIPGVHGAAELTVGEQFGCVRMPTGRVFCWGSNALGQLGSGPSPGPPCAVVPTGMCDKAPTPVHALSDATQISAGAAHACAVRSNGKVVCWGDGSFGRTGDPTYNGGATPLEVAGIDGALEVAAGDFSTCARTADAVYCWGRGLDGQLGQGGAVLLVCPGGSADTCSPSPMKVAGLGATTMIRAGLNRACAVLPSGKIACWGSNPKEALGIGNTASTSTPVTLKPLDGPKDLLVGYISSYAITIDGPWSWGTDFAADWGGTIHHLTPEHFAAVPDAVQLVGGWSHGCGLTKSGQVLCWGENSFGQLGDGTNASRTNPKPVKGL